MRPQKLPSMTQSEARDCVIIIKENHDSMRAAVIELHEREGWRVLGHASWKECCEKEFGYSRQYAYQLIAASKVSTMVDTALENPNERQLRALKNVPEADIPKVIEIAKSAGLVTAKAITSAVEKLKEANAAVIPKGAKVPDVLDKVGRVIPLVLVDSWNRRGEIDDLMTHVSKVRSKIKSAMDSGDPFYGGFDCGKYYSQLSQLYTSLKHVIPYTVCTTCQGFQRAVCTFCHGKGFICESDWDICVPVEVKEMIKRTVGR